MTAVEKAILAFAVGGFLMGGGALWYSTQGRSPTPVGTTPQATEQPPDDQPVTIAGGSLRTRSAAEWMANDTGDTYTYNSGWEVKKVQWACSYDVDKLITAYRKASTAVTIEIKYEAPGLSTNFHTVRYSTETDGTKLKLQIFKKNTANSVKQPLIRTFIDFLDHPKHRWTATSVTGKGLVTEDGSTSADFTCDANSTPKLDDGDFLLRIRPCKNLATCLD